MDGRDGANLHADFAVLEAVTKVREDIRDAVGAVDEHLVRQDGHFSADKRLAAGEKWKEIYV